MRSRLSHARPPRLPAILFARRLRLQRAQAALAPLEPPAGLHRPALEIGGLADQRALGMERPVGVVERLAADGDEIGLSALQHRLGLPGLEDEADRHGLDAGLAPDALGERHLESRMAGDARRR